MVCMEYRVKKLYQWESELSNALGTASYYRA
jgi:hypothetical protein